MKKLINIFMLRRYKMNKLAKTCIDLLTCNTILSNITTNDFVEDLIISIVVVILNFIILPLLKKLIEKMGWLTDKEKKQLKDETEKIVDKIEDELDKKD